MVATPLRGDETFAVVASRRQQDGRRFATTRRPWPWRSVAVVKAPVVDFFAWLAVGLALDKPARSSVSLV